MVPVFTVVDNAAYYVPDPIRPLVKPFYSVGRSIRTLVYESLPERIVETPYGVKLHVDYSNFVERTLSDGRFEKDFINYMRSELNDIDHFIDIGGNIGFFSLLVQQECQNCRVDIFEPLPRNVGRIIANEQINGSNLNVYPFALGESCDIVTLNVDYNHPGETTISGSLKSTEHQDRKIITTMFPIDEIIDKVPDAMKIDIEGAEVRMLKGGIRTLSGTPDLFLEIHPSNIIDCGNSLDQLVRVLDNAGYSTVYHIEEEQIISLSELRNVDSEHDHFHIH